MQLKFISVLATILILFAVLINAQEKVVEKDLPENTLEKTIESKEKIKVDFLFNYYDQDGDHSPVTGGKGTESQHVIAPVIIINIPFKKLNIIDINVGQDIISSASTDKIDGATSSASSKDTRIHGNLWYTRILPDPRQSIGLMAGFSNEFDVSSIQGGLRYSFQTADQNDEISFTAQYFEDKWKLIYPLELRPDLFFKTLKPLADDTRQSINFSINYSHVFTKDLQGSLTTDIVQQKGLLSTPFHRVFLDNNTTDIERLPDSRFKVAIGLKLNYYINDFISTRFFYRYYFDDFGVTANSFELELPIKVGKQFQVSPFYRFYLQSAADYFAAYQKNKAGSEFHTSDYDLSAFNSNLYGIQLRYTPLWDLWSGHFNIDSIDLRVAQYNRDDGLDAISISFGFSSSF